MSRRPSYRALTAIRKGGAGTVEHSRRAGIDRIFEYPYIRKYEGITYAKKDSDDFNYGKNLVYKACGKPFETILKNAGYAESEMYPINMEIGKADNAWSGFNIKTETIVNMKEEGIIDPHKVTKNALLNASSIAGTILLTECTVVDKPEDKKEQPMTIDPEKTAKIKQQPEEKQEKAPEQEKRQRASKKKVKKALDLNIDDIEI